MKPENSQTILLLFLVNTHLTVLLPLTIDKDINENKTYCGFY